MYFWCKGQTPRRGTVRLVRNGLHFPSFTSGRVQIYLTSWGHICDDADFNITEANVICHQQGYTGAAFYSKASSDLFVWVHTYHKTYNLWYTHVRMQCWHILLTIYRFGLNTSYPITLDNVDCSTSNYLTILQCRWSTIISSSCVHGKDDVSVTCCT